MKLSPDMIRIVRDSIGSNGRAVIARPFKVYVDHYAIKDPRGRTKRFGSRMQAQRAALDYIETHNEMEP